MSARDGGPMKLSIDQCARHGFWAVSICDSFGGERITPSKCCGSWSTVREFKLSENDWRRIAELATLAAAHQKALAEDAEHAAKAGES